MSGGQVGWPWCGDTPSGGERRGDCAATRNEDGSISLAWEPEDANCTVVGRELLEGIVEERNRLTAELDEAAGHLRGLGYGADVAGGAA